MGLRGVTLNSYLLIYITPLNTYRFGLHNPSSPPLILRGGIAEADSELISRAGLQKHAQGVAFK
jgi:hypothetical protein